jgi:outer membrane receptor protein involved in Fe transport
MNRIALSLLLLSAMLLLNGPARAQFPGGGNRGGQQMNVGRFYGKVLDSATGKPIEAASVQLLQNKLDSVLKKRRDMVVDGMLTNKKGEFSLENLPVMATYKLRITAIGYKPAENKVFFTINMSGSDFNSMLNAADKDLGNIRLKQDASQLQEVTVRSEKPLLTMAIDRKIFNVERSLNNTGGTAVDVMRNVPGLNVDIDGNVTMRNATPQIFVDGRPTNLTLEQIPADAIATIEMITNPSAKYDASGDGAGILNVVLKKNRKTGYNGSVRTSIDSRGRPGFGGDINLRQQKINFFASGQLNFRKTITTAQTNRTDFLRNGETHLIQNNRPIGTGLFGFGRTGFDFLIDNRNTLTLSGNLSKGEFRNTDLIRIDRDSVISGNTVYEYGERKNNSRSNFQNMGLTLGYKHNFAKAGKNISADVNYNRSRNDNTNEFVTRFYYPDASPKTPLTYEQSVGGGNSTLITTQVDFENPLNEKTKIEAGARIAVRRFFSFNDNYVKFNEGDAYIPLPNLNNTYSFTDRVMAVYGTLSKQRKNLSYQLGLRIESSRYDGDLITQNQQFSNEFPFSLFPSASATYKINDKQDLQFTYSRKINRPNFFQLIPFIDYSDSLNLSKGNPDLIPEFTNLVELSYQYQPSSGHTLLGSLYFRRTENLFTRYQYQLPNPNFPSKPDTVVMTTFANASSSATYGLELTATDKINSWWDMTNNFNLFNVNLQAGNVPGGVNSVQLSWFYKMNHTFKLPRNFTLQLNGDYQARTLVAPVGSSRGGRGGGGMMFGGGGNTPTAQGYILPIYGVDISIRKNFLKNNAASLTLQFNDIFRTRFNATHSESVFFVQDVSRIRDPQLARLNFNWRFGKVDVSLFKRKNFRSEMEGMQGAMPQ